MRSDSARYLLGRKLAIMPMRSFGAFGPEGNSCALGLAPIEPELGQGEAFGYADASAPFDQCTK
jgi:hypothetical protein